MFRPGIFVDLARFDIFLVSGWFRSTMTLQIYFFDFFVAVLSSRIIADLQVAVFRGSHVTGLYRGRLRA